MGVYNARGIIIGHQNWREADKFLSIYSEEYGKIKVMAKINFDSRVAIVASQISFCLSPSLDSSEICMPKASEKESAIAIVKIPPKTANLEPVPEPKPIIKPIVVITAEVRPKFRPDLNEVLIFFFDQNIV